MSPIVFLGFFIVGSSVGSPIANQYFDNLLGLALPVEFRLHNLDPAPISNFSTEFEDKVAIIGKVKGKADFFNGLINGLSRVRSYSECQGPYYVFGSKNFNCTIAFESVTINYDGNLKYGKVPKVSIKGKANMTSTLIFAEINQGASNLHPTLKKFQLQQLGKLQIQFTGLGPLNKYTKFLEAGFESHAGAEAYNSISHQFRNVFSGALKRVPMP